MHLLQTQAAQQASLKELHRARRATQQAHAATEGARISVLSSTFPANTAQLDELCPSESSRLHGGPHDLQIMPCWTIVSEQCI